MISPVLLLGALGLIGFGAWNLLKEKGIIVAGNANGVVRANPNEPTSILTTFAPDDSISAGPSHDYFASGVGTGVGSFTSLGSSGALGSGLAASSAVPIVGAVVGIGLGVYAAIKKHHADAVKREGAGMAIAIAHWNQGLILLVQGAAAGAYGKNAQANVPQMRKDLKQLYADYQKIVGSFQKGSPNIGEPSITVTGKVSPPAGLKIPSVCNGPCNYAYNYIVPQWWQALQHMWWASHGKHGSFIVPPLPADAKKMFPGSAGFRVDY